MPDPMVTLEMKPPASGMGEQVRAACLAAIGKEPIITIDVPTRLAFYFEALSDTELTQLGQALAGLEARWEVSTGKGEKGGEK